MDSMQKSRLLACLTPCFSSKPTTLMVQVALFKKLTGHSGKFGVKAISDKDKHSVPASFTNPYTGWRTWCIVCTSHEVGKAYNIIIFTNLGVYVVSYEGAHMHKKYEGSMPRHINGGSLLVGGPLWEVPLYIQFWTWTWQDKTLFQRGHFFWLEDHRKALGKRNGEVTEWSNGNNTNNEVTICISGFVDPP